MYDIKQTQLIVLIFLEDNILMIQGLQINCAIIDSDKFSRDRIENLLNMFDNISVKLKTGFVADCIKELKRINPDLVFLDVEMPDKTGFDIINEVRDSGYSPKFIFITESNQYAQKAIKAEVFDYILKPIDIDELKKAINRIYESTNKNQTICQRKYLDARLTKREMEIIQLVDSGMKSKEIAEKLCISKHTIDTHRRKITFKIKSYEQFTRKEK